MVLPIRTGIVLPAVSAALISLCSCSARRLPAPSGNYRLVTNGQQRLLLTPAVPKDQPDGRQIALRFGAAGPSARSGPAKCVIKGGLFSLARAGREWELRLPALRTWHEEDGAAEVQQAFDEFYGQLEQPDRELCLGPEGSVVAAGLLQESMPSPPSGAVYYRYRYRLGDGFVDLGPGMTLKMERAHFRPGSSGKQETLANYLGTTSLEYDVISDTHGRLGFRPAGFAVNPAELKVKRADLEEAKLVGHTTRMPFYRLFVSNDFVPRNFRRAAILLGARTRSRIEEATRVLKARPETACNEAPLAGMDCFAFTGRITVSAELWTTVQGKPLHVGVRALVRSVMGSRPGEARQAPETLRVERLFRGRYVPLEYTPGDAAVLDLAIVGGDKISW